METLRNEFKNFPLSHHAYGIESFSLEGEDITRLFDRKDLSYVFEKTYDTFKIDDARSIKALQSEKTEKASLFVLKFFHITHEAQNALLKVLEEPSQNSYFILIFPYAKELLDTLKSRLHLLRVDDEYEGIQLEPYLKLSLEQRFAYNKKVGESGKEDSLSKEDIAKFLNEAEMYLHTQGKRKEVFDILSLKKYLEAQGSSSKMILDQLAMILR